jgi:valyl-tRNA synthetase
MATTGKQPADAQARQPARGARKGGASSRATSRAASAATSAPARGARARGAGRPKAPKQARVPRASYDHAAIARRWSARWEESGIYRVDLRHAARPYYNLMMFPYPSAEGLHVGNMYAFSGADVHGRFMAAQGYDTNLS